MDQGSPSEKRDAFRKLLADENIHVAPGVADVLTGRLAASSGFPAVYLSGSLQHALRGCADVNALTMSEMVATAHAVADALTVPCLADAEAGFGTGVNVRRTVREYERAGVAGIHLEDSMVPKRPARLGFDSPTVTTSEFLDKIKAALDTRRDARMVLIARSEMRGSVSEKQDRLHAALELGADAFWGGGFSAADLPNVCARLRKPAVAVLPRNCTPSEFGSMGIRLAVIPGAMAVAALIAQRALLDCLKDDGSWSRWLEAQAGFERANDFYQGQGINDI